MADLLPEHKEGGEDGKPNSVVLLRDESSGLQFASSGISSEDTHQNKKATLHSPELQQSECGSSSSLHPVETSSEEAANSTERLVGKDGSETSEATDVFKKQDDEIGFSSDASKLAKTDVSQAKDPPDRELAPAEEMLVTKQIKSPAQGGASNEILSVSTKSTEVSVVLNDDTDGHPPPSTPALPEPALTGDVFKKTGTPTEASTSFAVECQESLTSTSEPTPLSTEKSHEVDMDLSSIVSSDFHHEKSAEVQTESLGSSKSSICFASVETGGTESSSTQSSSMSSVSDLCPASEAEHVDDSPNQSSTLASASTSKLSSTTSQNISTQEESGSNVALLVKEIEPHSQTFKAQCQQDISAENNNEDKVIGEKDASLIEGEKNCIEIEMPDNLGNVGQSEMEVEQSKNCNEVSLTNEAGTETLPLIIATRSLSKEQDPEDSTTTGESTVSTEMEATKQKIVPTLEAEPLKPVTIGSSLQPLEEIQEASVVEDTSFTTDMAIIDSSADEADSIGGLVINNVIGAADGVADFQPDEVETDKELTDISASAPQLEEASDLSDEHGPSAKRRRLENGPNSVEDKSNSAKKVILKVIPVKNGHGVWNSQKLHEVLSTKGTILLQIHASKESMELFEQDKDDEKADFTAIMAEGKDDDHDHILSIGKFDPEGDDPLSVNSASQQGAPSFGRPFSHPHVRSTALQPAMSRPGFKHLQTPQQYHMKNEVLGLPLPPPLEFEEPQMGSSDWSGMDTRTVAFPESQASTHSPVEESLLHHSPGPQSKVSREKVCPECGKVFHSTRSFKLHVSSHKPMMDCDMCSFKTKKLKKFRMHKLTHKKDNPGNKCFVCLKYFSTDVTLRIHQKKIHGVYVCKYCDNKYFTEEELKSHMQEKYGFTRKVKDNVEPSDLKQIKLQTTDTVSDIDENLLMCQFCKNLFGNKHQLKIHLAQHLGISSKEISDELLDKHIGLQKQRRLSQGSEENNDFIVECETQGTSEVSACNAAVKCEVVMEDILDREDTEMIPPVTNTSFKPSLLSHNQTSLISRANTKHESPTTNTMNELMEPTTVVNTSFEQLSAVSKIPSGQALLICNPVGLPMLRPHMLLQSPSLSTTNELTISPSTSASTLSVPSDQLTANHFGTTPVGMSAPEVTPSTSFLDNSQTVVPKILIPTQKKQSEKDKQYFPSCCVYCAAVFPTPGELKQHSLEAHPILTVRKDLLPRMIKEEVFETSKGSKPRKKHKAKIKLPCDTCGEVCNSYKTLRNHKKKHRKSFNCEECNIVHKNPHKLLRHQKKCHKDKYRCRFACGVLFDSYSELANHYKGVHDKDYSRIECPHCQKGFIYKASLMNHLEKCTYCPPDQRPAHICGNCEGFFPNVEAYNNHAKICHRPLKKEEIKDDVQENEASKTIENTGKKLEERITDILESENNSDDDSDINESSESSVEEQDANLPYDFRHKRSTTVYVKCKYCPNLLVEKDKGMNHILLSHREVVTCMTSSSMKCELFGNLCKTDDSMCKNLLKQYSKLNMWDALVPVDILKCVKVKNYCWICKSTYTDIRNINHGINRDIYIDKVIEIEESGSGTVMEPINCEKCNKSFSTRKNFWIHMKNHISTLPTISSPDELPEVDVDLKSHECTECQYKCSKMSEFCKHLMSHFLEEIKEES